MLTAGDALVNASGSAVERDLEVRQARTVAEAARTRLVACLSGQEDGIDLAEAQGMLDALKSARTLAADAEDRVLLHRGLLTPAEADKRAAKRGSAAARCDRPARSAPRQGRPAEDLRAVRLRTLASVLRPSGRRRAARVIAGILGIAVACAVGVILARRGGVRLPLAPR